MKEVRSGLVKGNVSDSVFERTITNYKATEKSIDRIAILNVNEKLVAKLHYIPDFGYVYCWGGACCKKYGTPIIRNIYPIIKYPTNNQGDVIKGQPEIQRLTISNTKDKDIIVDNNIMKQKGRNISHVDLLIIGGEKKKFDNTDWVDFTFKRCEELFWKKVKEWRETLTEQWKYYQENVETSIARCIDNDEEYFRLISNGNGNKNSTNFASTNTTDDRKALPDNTNVSVTEVDEDTDIDDFFTSEETTIVEEKTNDTTDFLSEKTENLTEEKDNSDFDPFS